jgi:hypothetical protein
MKQQSDIYNTSFIETLYESYLVNPGIQSVKSLLELLIITTNSK